MSVQHRCHSIEPVPIGIVLFEPEPHIAQKKPHHFVFTVVENPTVPQRMISFRVAMKVLVVSSVPHVDALIDVFGRVGMHDVNDNFDSVLVRLVDQLLELVRLSESGGHTEEVGDVVAKRAVVRMLHHSHNLNHVVTQFNNFW